MGSSLVQNKWSFIPFVYSAFNKSRDSRVVFRTKFLRGAFQFLFEFSNKVLLPYWEKHTVASVIDLFLMETLRKFKMINLPTLIFKHMHKVLHAKDGKHGLPYRYFLTKVCKNLKIKYVIKVQGTQPFSRPLNFKHFYFDLLYPETLVFESIHVQWSRKYVSMDL